MNNVFRDRIRRLSYGIFAIVAASLVFATICVGQGGSSGSIAGTVVDPNKAVVAGATVVILNNATKEEFTVVTNEEGFFRVPSVNAGVYTATVNGQGFKKTVVTNIKVNVGTPSSITVQMELGAATEQVTVTGGGELLHTENATVGTTLTGRQIKEIPTASRDALDLVLTMPGTATPGRPRTSTVNGLPKGALNITIDGINVQDNLLKSNDGFFTFVRPRTDAIDEVTVSTATPGAESSGEGAVQIKFTTEGGGSSYHGGVYWYHRNPALNANYWFFNRDNPDNNHDGKADQQRILLNQPGFKIGGPIWIPHVTGKDKAFFFVNYEEFRFPSTQPRTRTILSTAAQNGSFKYNGTIPTGGLPAGCVATGATTMQCTANLYAIAGGAAFDCDPTTAGTQPCPNSADPTVAGLLGQIRSSLSSSPIRDITNSSGAITDLNRQLTDIINPAGQTRKFPTVRFDVNPWKNHHFEEIWNYQQFRSQTDNLNGVDPAFPDFPNFGSQDSNRFSSSTGWRWTINNSVVNEARFGLTGGNTLFFAQVNAGQFANQGGYNLGIGAAGITSATVTNNPQRRNSPVWQFGDNVTWVHGAHALNFGFDYTRVNLFSQNIPQVVPNVSFALAANDPILNGQPGGLFNSTTLPGSSAADQSTAAAIYATLIGRVSGITASAFPDESGNFRTLGDQIQRAKQEEYGLFVQDTWKFRSNITLTGGLRWEIQKAPVSENNGYSKTTYPELFGVSGLNNLFKPGTQTGAQTVFTACDKGCSAYKTDYGNFAPSVGMTWSPNAKNGFFHTLLGDAGKSVFRAGFSMAYVREGTNVMLAILGSNPGGGGGVSASRSTTLGNLPVGTLLRSGPLTPINVTGAVTYPRTGIITDSANMFSPDLKTGYAESFTFGYQREVTPDTVFEVRYVGTRGHKLWRQYNLNETNTVENGFAAEFALAQQNLIANINCANNIPVGCTGGGNNFRYRGPGTGTSPLPIYLANFAGLPASAATNPANYLTSAAANNSFFANSTFINQLLSMAPNVIGAAGTLGNVAGNNGLFRPARNAAGLPANFFIVNPDLLGGSFVVDNGGASWYDGMTFEVRRRMAQGLLVQASYTFSKSETNMFASSSVVFSQYPTLRDPDLAKSISPFDITHSFKSNFIWELPVGRGKWLGSGVPQWADHLVGGWGVNGAIRIQSGTPFSLGHVQLVGLSAKDLQKEMKIRYDPTGARAVYFFPQDVIDNTRRAFNYGVVTVGGLPQISYIAPSGLTGNTAPTGRFIAPATYGNCVEAVTGQCGFANLVLHGPNFYRFDLSLVKRIKFTERVNAELRAEFLNAFNNINFRIGSANNDVTSIAPALINNNASFGITGSAYQDLSTTNDPGGRMVQLVLRLNF